MKMTQEKIGESMVKSLKILLLILFLCVVGDLISINTNITHFKFTPSPVSNIANYIIYYGNSSSNYTYSNNIGNTDAFSLTLTNPVYVVVEAQNNIGMLSDYSNETYSNPYLSIRLLNRSNIIIKVEPITNQILTIQKSYNPLSGYFDYSTNNILIENIATNPMAYYRIVINTN